MNTPSSPNKTLGDYLAILISPILIMALVGSLVFFCVKVAYRGENGGMIRWTLFWFVLAAVLVSRICIENSSTQGKVYGMLLGVVTGMVMTVYVDWVIGCWVLLALAWWFASKLTWDCTLLDDLDDTSGGGLLEAAGFEDKAVPGMGLVKQPPGPTGFGKIAGVDLKAPIPIPTRAPSGIARTPAPGGLQGYLPSNQKPKLPKPKPRELAHSPGMWVIYFSLAAMPIFGLGQHFIPKAELAQRNDAFSFVFVYVIAALGLLLCSSFLNLRRYLRQRSLRMPPAMAASWVGRGVVLGAVMVGLAILLPRPQATYSLTSLLDSLDKKKEPPAKIVESSLPGVEKHSNRIGQGQDGRTAAHKSGVGKEEGENDRPAGRQGNQGGGGEKSARSGSQRREAIPALGFGSWMKILVYAPLALFAAWHLYKNWAPLWAAFLEMLRSWREFLKKLLSGDFASNTRVKPAIRTPIKQFESLDNPFRTNAANQRSLDELARCTLEAVECWANASQMRREQNQTPSEFLRALANQWPEIADSTGPFAEVYGRVAYGGPLTRANAQQAFGVMERLWRSLESQRNG